MNLILNNPYRILGLLVGAKAAEQARQISKIKTYIDAEQDIPKELLENSFRFLGEVCRTMDTVNDAVSKLNLDSDKMAAALFWFYKGNEITDEPAFDALNDGDFDTAFETWNKLVSAGLVSQRNASAYNNLSNLYLGGFLDGTDIASNIFRHGILFKLQFIESDFAKNFKALATDETYKTTKKEMQLLFLSQLETEVGNNGVITSNEFIEILSDIEFIAKEDYLKGFVLKPIEFIEKKIQETKAKRSANKANAANAGKILLEKTTESFAQLKSILGTTNLKYTSIADKFAMELFACGRDYFMHYRDSETDPSKVSMSFFKRAKTIAIGNIASQQIEENIDNLQEWIDEKPERDKRKLIESDLSSLLEILQTFDESSDTVENAKLLINQSKPKLLNIREALGESDDLYLTLSTRVAAMAQHNVIVEVNAAQENISAKLANDRNGTINKLKATLINAWSVTKSIGTLDMEYDFKINRYYSNRESLEKLCSQLDVNTNNLRSGTTNTPSSNKKSDYDVIADWILNGPGAFILIIGLILILIKACG